MIPITVVTGFLGSGKTTLLAAWLGHAALANTAVIINEFGEIGIDHDLIETSDESVVSLTTGCLCCAVRSDLVATLGELLAKREAGAIRKFERVVIETSGLADPIAIVQSLIHDRSIGRHFVLERVVTTVDGVLGIDTLNAHAEALRQVAVADRIILTKSDLAAAKASDLAATLRRINPSASQFMSTRGRLDPRDVFAGATYDVAAVAQASAVDELGDWLHGQNATPDMSLGGHVGDHHAGAVQSVCLVRREPIHAVTLSLFLEALADHCGTTLLRLKGIVNIVEEPNRPAVIHGVQHVFHAPAWLARWPSADRSTRLVLIGYALSEAWLSRLLSAIEQEVCDVRAETAAAIDVATAKVNADDTKIRIN